MDDATSAFIMRAGLTPVILTEHRRVVFTVFSPYMKTIFEYYKTRSDYTIPSANYGLIAKNLPVDAWMRMAYDCACKSEDSLPEGSPLSELKRLLSTSDAIPKWYPTMIYLAMYHPFAPKRDVIRILNVMRTADPVCGDKIIREQTRQSLNEFFRRHTKCHAPTIDALFTALIRAE